MNTFDLFSMKGKKVLITGGRAMYGLGATHALADAGAEIYLATHSPASVQPLIDELRQTKHVQAKAIAFDLQDTASIEHLVKTVWDDAGRIDAFIHCSRIIPTGGIGTGWDQDPVQLEQSVRINSAGSLYLLQLVGEKMKAQNAGSIVVFSSMMGLVGVEKHNYDGNPQMLAGAYAPAYAVDKSGLSAWVRHAASYYGKHNVRINAVCPGGLASERTNPVFAEQYSLHTQLGRLANSDDIKGVVLFLASDASAYFTGLNLPVDGGYTCI